MFKKFLGLLGIGLAMASTSAVAQSYTPYARSPAASAIYNLLFCDDPSAFQPSKDGDAAAWQLLIYGPSPDPGKISALAQDTETESRVRALAYNWLRAHGHKTPKGIVLGVIIEVPLKGGLDVLAVYADGRVRYINQTGKMAIIEPESLAVVNAGAMAISEQAKPVVARIGPWDKGRLPPPVRPNVRVTFIVSDGLYFGEGPFDVLQQDDLAGPLLTQGVQLLQMIPSDTP